MISLWDYLKLLSGASALGGALAASRIVELEKVGILVVWALGLTLGAFSIWFSWVASDRLFRGIRAESCTDFVLRLMYLGAVFWLAVPAFSVELDDCTVLEPGDVVVQQATNHGWVNRGGEPCRILFVLMDAKEP